MNKYFTLAQSSQSFSKIKTETQSFQSKIKFLQDYTRAFKTIKTNSISHIEFSLN